MVKQPEKTEQTKQALLDAFCLLYQKKPIEKITVQEITRKAGFNRCTFYQYFTDIYELLDYIENDILNYIKRNHPKEIINNAEQSLVQEFVRLYDDKSAYLNALLGYFGSNRFLERLKAKIPLDNHGFDLSGEGRITPYLLEFHTSVFLSLFQLWHRRKKDLTMEEFTDLIIRLNNKGMSAFF